MDPEWHRKIIDVFIDVLFHLVDINVDFRIHLDVNRVSF